MRRKNSIVFVLRKKSDNSEGGGRSVEENQSEEQVRELHWCILIIWHRRFWDRMPTQGGGGSDGTIQHFQHTFEKLVDIKIQLNSVKFKLAKIIFCQLQLLSNQKKLSLVYKKKKSSATNQAEVPAPLCDITKEWVCLMLASSHQPSNLAKGSTFTRQDSVSVAADSWCVWSQFGKKKSAEGNGCGQQASTSNVHLASTMPTARAKNRNADNPSRSLRPFI